MEQNCRALRTTGAFDDPDDNLAAVDTKDSLTVGWMAWMAQRYAQAKVNAQHSKDSFARLLRLIAAARLAGMNQKVSRRPTVWAPTFFITRLMNRMRRPHCRPCTTWC